MESLWHSLKITSIRNVLSKEYQPSAKWLCNRAAVLRYPEIPEMPDFLYGLFSLALNTSLKDRAATYAGSAVSMFYFTAVVVFVHNRRQGNTDFGFGSLRRILFGRYPLTHEELRELSTYPSPTEAPPPRWGISNSTQR